MILEGRTVLITGGSSGIGFEMARRLLDRGNVVIVTGRDEAKLALVETKLPGVHAIRCDVGDDADIHRLHERVVSQFPSLDIVVNNAGIMRDIKVSHDRPLDDVAKEIDIDLKGPIKVVQRFLPHLLTRPDAAIVNVTSGLAFVPWPASPIYSAAKAGLRAYTRALRVQLAHSKVRVFELAPPATDTDLFNDLAGTGPRSIKPMPLAALADKAIAGIAADRLEIAPGLARVLRSLSRLAPGFAFKQLSKASGY